MHIDVLDLGYLDAPGAASAFLVASERDPSVVALVETGPAACIGTLNTGLERTLKGRTVAAILLTHVHLDHAGATGHVLSGPHVAPRTNAWIHPLGAPHVVDPAKLIASSRRVHGATFDRHYGEPLPADASRVHAADDGAVLQLGPLTVTACATPGHAAHHHAWIFDDGAETVAFTGDVAGMVLPGMGQSGADLSHAARFISIPMPPNQFDAAAWRASLERLLRLRPTRVAITHGGLVSANAAESEAYLAEATARFEEESAYSTALVHDLRDGRVDEAEAIRRYGEWLARRAGAAGVSVPTVAAYLGPRFCRMNVDGVRRSIDTAGGGPARGSGPR
ncbi:MAG: MBL fold metallo-hydrolase [Phycisphaerae bacterium]|nr:MBL fold metallo-hydrolase [Phycisphaerae bacterium]